MFPPVVSLSFRALVNVVLTSFAIGIIVALAALSLSGAI